MHHAPRDPEFPRSSRSVSLCDRLALAHVQPPLAVAPRSPLSRRTRRTVPHTPPSERALRRARVPLSPRFPPARARLTAHLPAVPCLYIPRPPRSAISPVSHQCPPAPRPPTPSRTTLRAPFQSRPPCPRTPSPYNSRSPAPTKAQCCPGRRPSTASTRSAPIPVRPHHFNPSPSPRQTDAPPHAPPHAPRIACTEHFLPYCPFVEQEIDTKNAAWLAWLASDDAASLPAARAAMFAGPRYRSSSRSPQVPHDDLASNSALPRGMDGRRANASPMARHTESPP